MNKYLKYFSSTLVGLMLSTSAFAAAEYAVVLKTLSNPFWVDMKKGIEDEAKTLGVSVDILPLLQKAIFNLNCSYLKISVIKLQRYRLRSIILSESGHACRPRMEKRHLSG
ncbi:D-allose-binding periplasmic protein [Escherichia coli]|nr:D-allose-binding periplasmic protein [Escherichia coli]